MADKRYDLNSVYRVKSPEEAREFYTQWAKTYDSEVKDNGYITPRRCAAALKQCVPQLDLPIMDLACGTGLSGLALQEAGFSCIDGYDFSPAMLEQARTKGVYRELGVVDLSQALHIKTGKYTHAAAIGCVSPEYMPATVLDAILQLLPNEGCLVFSVNDHAAADGSIAQQIDTMLQHGRATLAFKDYGKHLPNIDLCSHVYVLRKTQASGETS